jgi:hypothetical protein
MKSEKLELIKATERHHVPRCCSSNCEYDEVSRVKIPMLATAKIGRMSFRSFCIVDSKHYCGSLLYVVHERHVLNRVSTLAGSCDTPGRNWNRRSIYNDSVSFTVNNLLSQLLTRLPRILKQSDWPCHETSK